MVFPHSVGAHILGRYYWCASESKILAHEESLEKKLPKDCMLEGITVHEWLASRPKSKTERKLLFELEQVRPWYRILDGTKIYAHPDDFGIRKRLVQIREYKSVDKYDIDPFVVCSAVLQTKIGSWVLEPILRNLKYRLDGMHEVSLYNRKTAYFIGRTRVFYDPEEIVEELRFVFGVYRGENPLIPPKRWKCRVCDSEIKRKCSLRGFNHVS